VPTKKSQETTLQLTITLSEVQGLRSRLAELEREVAQLRTTNEELTKKLHSLTDPAQKTAAAAFKRSRGYKA